MGSNAKAKHTLLKLRILVIGTFLAFALILSLSISSYSNSKSQQQPRARHPAPATACAKPSPPPGCKKLPLAVAQALIHYAATNVTPQQTAAELKVSANVLQQRGPCNFLVFGLGHDSLLWATLNYGGRTVFLEEDEDWIGRMRARHPELESHYVQYPTMVTEAYDLLKYAQTDPDCFPAQSLEYSTCKLALQNLPADVYNTEWDVIMIDAPRGYFPEAPGRMQAIWSSAVMARNRPRGARTDVFVHDVARSVESSYSKAFLCEENLVASQGKLWHFGVPAGVPSSPEGSQSLCAVK